MVTSSKWFKGLQWSVQCALPAILVASCAYTELPRELDAGNAYTVAAGDDLGSYNAVQENNSVQGLRRGDRLAITFPNAPELNTTQLVQPSGQITSPYVGSLFVAGRSTMEITQELQQRYETVLKKPVLAVTVVELAEPIATPEVFVIGAVQTPGAVPLRRSMSAVHAIASAGGPSEQAARHQIAVIRLEDNAYVATIYDYRNAFEGNSPLGAAAFVGLRDGDIVFVPRSNLSRAAQIMEQVRSILGFRAEVLIRYPRNSF